MLKFIKHKYRQHVSPHCKGKHDTYEAAAKECGTNYEEIELIDLDDDKYIFYQIIFLPMKLLLDTLQEKYNCTVKKEDGYMTIRGKLIDMYEIHAEMKR